jgi:hypothetical protein
MPGDQDESLAVKLLWQRQQEGKQPAQGEESVPAAQERTNLVEDIEKVAKEITNSVSRRVSSATSLEVRTYSSNDLSSVQWKVGKWMRLRP